MAIDLTNYNITNRDFNSIYQELLDIIPNISQSWKSTEDSDPGIVLVKLIAILGDMLSYNHDRAVSEAYPATVLQRKNAAQIFKLIGYKMHWYQSAKCLVTIQNKTASQKVIPPFSIFSTIDNSIKYTNIEPITLPPLSSGKAIAELIQGIPITPYRIVANLNTYWHSQYAFNILLSDLIDNKFYINGNTNIDESNIILIDNLGNVWEQVEDLSTTVSVGSYFEFDIDTLDRPYIKLVDYWNDYNVTMFKLFYIQSNGYNGQVLENTLTNFWCADETIDSQDILITNDLSTSGNNPETADEARTESAKYINTYNTLITLDDFTRATKRIKGVANCIATDKTTDPEILTDYTVKIYVTPEESYYIDANLELGMNDDDFAQLILEELRDYKLMPLNIKINFNSIIEYKWNVGATIYLKEPVIVDNAHNIIVKINNILKAYYSVDRINYNSILNIASLINVIMSADPLIYNIDLDYIKYYKIEGENTYVEVTKEEVTGSYLFDVNTYSYFAAGDLVVTLAKNSVADVIDYTGVEITIKKANLPSATATITCDIGGNLDSDEEDIFEEGTINLETGLLTLTLKEGSYNILITYNIVDSTNNRYTFVLPNTPLKPGSIYISLDNYNSVINDDSHNGLLSKSTIFNSGNVDYALGVINIELMDTIVDYNISYTKNVINIVKFDGVDITKLKIANDSIKR